MKRLLGFVLVAGVLVSGWSVQPVQAQEESQQVTQGEMARLLVNILGLYRFLPAAPTDQECIAVLLQNEIAPEGGWDAQAVVTRADLARVIVQALNQEDQIEDKNNTQQYIDLLKTMGIPIDSIGQAVDNLGPLAEPVAPNVFDVTTDPLKTAQRRGEPDELESGADASFIAIVTRAELEEIIEEITVPEEQEPVTPN